MAASLMFEGKRQAGCIYTGWLWGVKLHPATQTPWPTQAPHFCRAASPPYCTIPEQWPYPHSLCPTARFGCLHLGRMVN
jgi:hypothetical protein